MGHLMNLAATLLALVPAGVIGVVAGNRLRRDADRIRASVTVVKPQHRPFRTR